MRSVLCCVVLVVAACADMDVRGGEASRPLQPPRLSARAGIDSQLTHSAFLKVVNQGFTLWSYPIDMDGDTMVAGGPHADMGYDSAGAAFVFVRDGDGWSQQAILALPIGERGEGQFFSTSLSIQGDMVALGAPGQGNGRVHIFERSGTVWTRTATLGPAFEQPGIDGYFGRSVMLDGDRLAVGATGDSSASTGVGGDPTNQDAPYSGAAHVFVREGADWVLEAYVKPSNTTANHNFGETLSLSGDTLAVNSLDESNATGVNGDQTNTDAPGSGAVFVFHRGAGGWAQQAYVKASNTGAGDAFGRSQPQGPVLLLDGDRLVVGASGEDSAATGVGGDQASNDAPDSGAAYTFTRTGATWAQEAYVKASNTGAGDRFGSTVALLGDTLVVSAIFEDSAATDVDGDQSSEAAPNSGAVYFFEREGDWSQAHYVKAFNTAANDWFGWSLAWDGHRLAVGAEGQEICPEPDPACDDQFGGVYVLE
jgi:trimeric autotransporter adhesin